MFSLYNRRHSRVKVLSILYSYYVNPNLPNKTYENNLKKSIEKTYDLFMYLLIISQKFFAFWKKKSKEKLAKNLYNELQTKNINKFITANVSSLLEKYIESQKQIIVDTTHEEMTLLKIYEQIETDTNFLEIFNNEEFNSKNAWINLFNNVLPYQNELEDLISSKDLYWNDDYQITCINISKWINLDGYKKINEVPELFKSNEDEKFLMDLFKKTIEFENESDEKIKSLLKNWDYDRVALMDKILLRMAYAEFSYFLTIPKTVIINEYIELAKHYSGDKSSIFINGIIDKLKNNNE